MVRFTRTAIASLVFASLAALSLAAPSPARADDLGKKITINLSPVYSFSTAGDDNAPPGAGFTPLGYTKDHPLADSLRLDYGISFAFDAKTSLSFSHSNIAYQLGRITSIPTGAGNNYSLVTGAINDYTNTIALSRALGGGLGVHVTYFDHQRSSVTGLCLNQKSCPVGGVQTANPLSIDEHGYTFGGTYDFGPKTRIGSLLSAAIDLKYVPRPAVAPPGAALGGLGSYPGSQILFPYSLTAKIPILPSTSVVPFINYTNLPVLYRDSAVPEAYRGIVFGLVKVINKNLTLSYTNLNLQSCRCIARVPPPDNLRLSLGLLKLDVHTQL
jgi:hypothetical protein